MEREEGDRKAVWRFRTAHPFDPPPYWAGTPRRIRALTRSLPLALLATLAACNGGLGGPRECPYEDIAPTEVCTFDQRAQLICSTCDPTECSNCPLVWQCGSVDGVRRWNPADHYDCVCTGPDGNTLDTGNCWPDS